MDHLKAREACSQLGMNEGWGRRVVFYKLKDWLVSRQRAWGTPIPIIHCPTCGVSSFCFNFPTY